MAKKKQSRSRGNYKAQQWARRGFVPSSARGEVLLAIARDEYELFKTHKGRSPSRVVLDPHSALDVLEAITSQHDLWPEYYKRTGKMRDSAEPMVQGARFLGCDVVISVLTDGRCLQFV